MAVITGTRHADTLPGTAAMDVIFGRGGADVLLGREGDDLAFGAAGNDTIAGDNSPLPGGGPGPATSAPSRRSSAGRRATT